MKSGNKAPVEIPRIFGLPILLVLGFLAVLSIPFTAVLIICYKVRDYRFFQRLKSRQRVMNWSEIERHLDDGRGTLIIEQANKVGARFWWTADDLITIAPVPIISSEGDLGLSYVTGKTSDPFVPWCFENYLSVEKGKAFLTRPDRSKLPPGPVTSEFLKSLHPKANIVHTLWHFDS